MGDAMTTRRTDDREHLRERVLLATLPHVPFEGWSDGSLAAGLADAGLEEGARFHVFPGGVPDLIDYFNAYTDARMEAVLEQTDLETMKMRDRIAAAVRVRLDLLARHREAVRRGMAYLALPQNAALGLKCLYRTVDAMWRGIGDASTDFSFYTKRALLAGVYSATLFYWLDDESEDFQDTLAFLDRRIGNVLQLQRTRERVERALSSIPNPLGWLAGASGRD